MACLAAAVLIFVFTSGGGDEKPPKGEELITQWKCKACGDEFKLKSSEWEAAEVKAGGSQPLFCPKCGQKEAYQPMECPLHNLFYFGPEVPDSPGVCPECQKENRIPEPEPEPTGVTNKPRPKSV